MQTISYVKGREVLDSRGNPTIEVEIGLSDGATGRAIVPSGASTGQHEALELRDHDKKRYLGKGTLKAVHNVNETVAKALKGKSFSQVRDLDKVLLEIDKTPQKANLGANAILGTSLAFVQALSASQKRPLFLIINEMMSLSAKDLQMPIPLMNIINGGMHANNGLEIQEFMIVPHGFADFSEALRSGVEIFHALKKKLDGMGMSTSVGDEGGFAPDLKSNTEALDVICQSVEAAGYMLGKQVSVALDAASSSFLDEPSKKYKFAFEGKDTWDAQGLIAFYASCLEKYPLVSIEDGLEENDWDGWKKLTEKLGKRVQLVGDDLFVTQTAFVEKGIKNQVANAVLIKVNQVGSLSETFDTMNLCRKNGYRCVTSHRSGETEDTTIAHLAVGSGCGQIKTGSASRSERMAKYNELLRISEWARENKISIPLKDIF